MSSERTDERKIEDSKPIVSIIVPCYNEQDTIQLLLQAIYDQTIPRQEMEVVIADGLSTDNTRQEIESFQQFQKPLPAQPGIHRYILTGRQRHGYQHRYKSSSGSNNNDEGRQRQQLADQELDSTWFRHKKDSNRPLFILTSYVSSEYGQRN